jgi:hypothetical protein
MLLGQSGKEVQKDMVFEMSANITLHSINGWVFSSPAGSQFNADLRWGKRSAIQRHLSGNAIPYRTYNCLSVCC